MKQKLAKCLAVCKRLYGWGIMILLFVGGSIFFGFLAALFIGGSAAAAICDFIYVKLVPVMVVSNTVIIVLGVACLYFSGEKALMAETKKK